MAIVEQQRSVNAHAELVWTVVADPACRAGLPAWIRRVELLEGDDLGLRRRVVGMDGHAWIEECTEWSPGVRFTMRVVDGDFPLKLASVRYTCAITQEDSNVRLRLYFDYLPRFGPAGRLLEGFTIRPQLAAMARELLDHWIRIIHIREWAHRVTVASLLDEKGHEVISVTPETQIAAAARVLEENRIGSVMVLDAERAIAGVLSERDIVRGLSDTGAALLDQPVSSIMTRDVIVAAPGDNMMKIMACMSNSRIRHLPVVEQGKTLGVISIGDVVKARISELEGQSETLRDFIEARRWHELYREIGPAAYAADSANEAR